MVHTMVFLVGPHWDFLIGFLQIFLQSILSGYFNVGLSTSAFLQLGMLVLKRCSVPAWLWCGADGRRCRVALPADAGAAARRRRPDQRRRRVGDFFAGVNLTTYGVVLLAAVRRSADDLCGAARRPAHPLVRR
jgi:hypothetical protein